MYTFTFVLKILTTFTVARGKTAFNLFVFSYISKSPNFVKGSGRVTFTVEAHPNITLTGLQTTKKVNVLQCNIFFTAILVRFCNVQRVIGSTDKIVPFQ